MKNQAPWSRRQFLEFLGATSLAGGLSTTVLGVGGCSSVGKKADRRALKFKPLAPSMKDELRLSEGLESQILIKYGEKFGGGLFTFGYNNDYTAYLPMNSDNPDEGWLWVNHESVHPLLVSGRGPDSKIDRKKVHKEMKAVGGSLLHIRKVDGDWEVLKDSKNSYRLDATSTIPFAGGVSIEGSTAAVGTLANCAGGVTPWGTFLSCEENYDDFYGETVHRKDGSKVWRPSANYLQWEKYKKRPPEHYGWVVEFNPETKKAQKHTSLGRFAHECATVTRAKSGKIVVYSGDDANDEFIYKLISDSSVSLESGVLYAADTKNGKWLPLEWESQLVLRENFKDQLDVLIRAREAARLLGATPQNRPEDIEVNPNNGDILVALTNNKPRGDYMGRILKITEQDADPGALEFESEALITGGSDSGFACPDNMAFDQSGNLWFTTDISGGSLGSEPYKEFGNNALFYVPMVGVNAGIPIRVATAPVASELTGPSFSPDGKTLFLSVQHPGETTTDLDSPTSHWPDQGDSLPKPAVVAISLP